MVWVQEFLDFLSISLAFPRAIKIGNVLWKCDVGVYGIRNYKLI